MYNITACDCGRNFIIGRRVFNASLERKKNRNVFATIEEQCMHLSRCRLNRCRRYSSIIAYRIEHYTSASCSVRGSRSYTDEDVPIPNRFLTDSWTEKPPCTCFSTVYRDDDSYRYFTTFRCAEERYSQRSRCGGTRPPSSRSSDDGSTKRFMHHAVPVGDATDRCDKLKGWQSALELLRFLVHVHNVVRTIRSTEENE
jgi:hypothetical protein